MIRSAKRFIIPLLAGLSFATSAAADNAPAPVYQAWLPQGNATLSVTSVSANVALPSAGLVATVSNTGATDVYFALGTSNSIAATASGYRLAAGKCVVVSLSAFGTLYTYLAAITGSSTSSLYIETGAGAPQTCSGIDGGTGAPTIIGPTSISETGLSGSITTGGTFQTLSASGSRTSFEFQNICNVPAAGACVSTTDNCYLNFLASGAAKATSVLIAPGAYYGRTGVSVPSNLISVTCDGTGDQFWSQKQ